MPQTINKASIGKRLLAFLIDAAAVTLCSVLTVIFLTDTYFASAIGRDADIQGYTSFLVTSGIFSAPKKDDGSYDASQISAFIYYPTEAEASSASKTQTGYGYALYYEKVSSYYRDFLRTNEHIDGITDSAGTVTAAKDYYTPTYFATKILGLQDPASVDPNDETSLGKGNNFYKYVVTDGKVDVAAKPVLQKAVEDKVNAADSATLTALNSYFFSQASSSDTPTGLYYNAAMNLEKQTYFTTLYNSASVKTWGARALGIEPFILIFFLVIPLIDKKGRTIGKMITKLGVIDIGGFKARFSSHFLHNFIVALVESLIIIYPTQYGIMAFLLINAIELFFMLGAKKGQTLHERAAHTLVVDLKSTKLYKTKEEAVAAQAAADKEEAEGVLDPSNPTVSFTKGDEAKPAPAQPEATKTQVVDASIIGQARSDAGSISSFDEFENNGSAPSKDGTDTSAGSEVNGEADGTGNDDQS